MVGGLRAARREVVASRPMLMEPVRARVVAVERLSARARGPIVVDEVLADEVRA